MCNVGDPNYQPFNIRVIPSDQYEWLTAHNVDVAAKEAKGDQVFFM